MSCHICQADSDGGSLAATSEVRNAGGWNPVFSLTQVSLCYDHYAAFIALTDLVTTGARGVGEPILGIPMRDTTVALEVDHCDACQATLAEQAATVELVPEAQAYRRGSRTRREGAMRRLRVCRQCLAWWRSILEDSSAITGEGTRALEGPTGGWLRFGASDAVAHALRPRDLAILAATVETDDGRFRYSPGRPVVRPGEVLFLGAGKRDRATTIVSALEPAIRQRVALVAHVDQLHDASRALRAGASELLASPLSPQQVNGALLRINRANRYRRDPATGLPILGAPAADFGQACLSFVLSASGGMEVLENALLARRFLRGYDEVGCDGRGNLAIHVYADPAMQEALGGRLTRLLGRRTQVRTGAVAGIHAVA